MCDITRSAFALAPTPMATHRGPVPKGQLTIAQRFNAGMADQYRRVPKGRLNGCARALPVGRPFGTYPLLTVFPALKRRAIVGSLSGTTLQATHP